MSRPSSSRQVKSVRSKSIVSPTNDNVSQPRSSRVMASNSKSFRIDPTKNNNENVPPPRSSRVATSTRGFSIDMTGQVKPNQTQRASLGAMEAGNAPTARKEEVKIVKEEVIVTKIVSKEEHDTRRRRGLFFIILVALLFLAILMGVRFFWGGKDKEDDSVGVPRNCGPVNNQTKPGTYQDYMCDLMKTVTRQEEYTFLNTYRSNTPHGMAVLWMLNSDHTDFINTPRDLVMERYVMAVFYFSTGGKEWYNRYEFLTPSMSTCDWTGGSKDAIRCAFADRKVTDIGLPQNGMVGQIPTELGYLTGLTRLYLSLNGLTGTIPSELSQLTNLRRLYLDRNQMQGNIPTEITNLGLKTLYLTNNDFRGDLSPLCENVDIDLHDYHADCDTGRVTCRCCRTCI